MKRSDFLPPFPTASFALYRRYRLVPLVRSHRTRGRHPRAWVVVYGSPAVLFDGDDRISQVPGESLPTCPALRPRWVGPPSPYRCGPMLPSDSFNVVSPTGSNSRGSITQPVGSLFTLRRPGHPGATQNSLPACWLGFDRAGLTPAGFRIEFQVFSASLPLEPGFSWRNERLRLLQAMFVGSSDGAGPSPRDALQASTRNEKTGRCCLRSVCATLMIR
jgi:hypothetical protein